jgi:hypothetical protein
MAIFIAVVSVVNMGLGFGLGVYLGRQQRDPLPPNAATARAEQPREAGQNQETVTTAAVADQTVELRPEGDVPPPQSDVQPASGIPADVVSPVPVVPDTGVSV